MSKVLKSSMFSVLGVLGAANYFRGLDKEALNRSKKERQERIQASPQFKNGRVVNRMPKSPVLESKARLRFKSVFSRDSLKPRHELPLRKADLKQLRLRSEELRVTWLGHSSLFVEMNHTRFLLDPVFEFACPLIVKPLFDRNVATPVSKESLPLPDVIVISHDHYDHLEKTTIKYFADKPVRFFVPLGVGQHLENWGVEPDKIEEFDWWESKTVNGVKLTSAPANHNSGRTGADSNKTLWCSWALQSERGAVFFSGDTAYDRHFKEINKRLGHFDMAFMEVAANVKEGRGFPVENCGHMQARHTMQAFRDLGADKLFPVHWATFELFTHRWDEPMADLIDEANSAGISLVTPMIGESISANEAGLTSYWWQQPEKEERPDLLRMIDAELSF